MKYATSAKKKTVGGKRSKRRGNVKETRLSTKGRLVFFVLGVIGGIITGSIAIYMGWVAYLK